MTISGHFVLFNLAMGVSCKILNLEVLGHWILGFKIYLTCDEPISKLAETSFDTLLALIGFV
jgi:hypothetical protein